MRVDTLHSAEPSCNIHSSQFVAEQLHRIGDHDLRDLGLVLTPRAMVDVLF